MTPRLEAQRHTLFAAFVAAKAKVGGLGRRNESVRTGALGPVAEGFA
jgi:hypothetical protein